MVTRPVVEKSAGPDAVPSFCSTRNIHSASHMIPLFEAPNLYYQTGLLIALSNSHFGQHVTRLLLYFSDICLNPSEITTTGSSSAAS